MTDTGGPEREVPEFGLIADEDLPDDLQPAQNPLARDPGDEPAEGEAGEDQAGADAPARVEGMPDVGDPGLSG